MKLLVMLFFIFGISCAIYLFITYFIFNFNKLKKINWIAFSISAFVGLSLITLIGIAIYRGSKAPDTWCATAHVTNSYPPAELNTAMDYFEKGNYEYDRGNCKEAISNYTKAIKLDPNYPQTYNNLAFTFMREGNYQAALDYLNIALNINPNYLNALTNRADIYNYYLKPNDPDSAIVDYRKIIELGGSNPTVCGHLYLARHKGWNLNTIIGLPLMMMDCD